MLTSTSLKQIELVKEELGKVIRGKSEAIELLLGAILCGGHVLLEDTPGVGKTTLAKCLAKTLDIQFARVQFTPDLLPTDLLGMSLLDPRDGSFTFHEGPIFTNLMLADEINRASPRTQSALLEAMNETQVTIENATRPLPEPFFVIATQNPIDYQGTYPLPEAQLDRFFVKLSLGYPKPEEELRVLFDRQHTDPIESIKPILDKNALLALQREVKDVTVDKDVGRYILRIVEATRQHPELEIGASPRASLALFRASQGKAFLEGRSFVIPDDIQRMSGPVLEHRLMMKTGSKYGGKTEAGVVASIIDTEEIPV